MGKWLAEHTGEDAERGDWWVKVIAVGLGKTNWLGALHGAELAWQYGVGMEVGTPLIRGGALAVG